MARKYELKNIRALLTEGFTADELRRLCHDESDFKPVYHKLAQDTGKATIIDWLLEYANQKLKIEALLAWAKEHNPAMYEEYQPYYGVTISPTRSSNIHPNFQRARKHIRVLIVDDDGDVRKHLSQIFKSIGCETVEAKTNAEAIDFLLGSRMTFTILTTDAFRRSERAGEQGYIGLDLVRIVNKRLPNLPVILVSRDSPDILRKQASDLRVSALVAKNISEREMITVLQKVLDGEILPNPWTRR
jgi:CheY-like chemotaxis protein